MLTKEQIRGNRDKLRSLTRVNIVETMVETRVSTDRSSEELSPYKKTYSKETIMRQRKKSEDLSIFENPCRNKDVYINCKFFDLFDVAEKLGEGSQSIVRRCIEIASKKSFAVKLFRNSDVELISTLKTQYKILKVLSHPNIIEAHNLFVNEQERNCQLVLDYCPYPQLKDFLDRNGRLQEDEVSEIIEQLLQAVSYMHEKGICHRDIKPQNILYDCMERQIKLIDFDISKMNRKVGKVEMWSMTGTLYYKAPEMFSGKYNELIDVWSIGVTAYELLTGSLPFQSQYLNDTIESIKNDSPEYPQFLSKFAINFLRRCLCKNPSKRITAKEALSCPFILQRDNSSLSGSPNLTGKLNQSFDSKGKSWTCDEQDEFKFELAKCYEDDHADNDNFLDSNDIGIRCSDGHFL